MALLRYLQCTDDLPDPRGSLSSAVPRQAIAHANEEVQPAMDSEVEAAYICEVQQKRSGGLGGDVTALSLQKRSRPVLLSSGIDLMV